MSLALGALYRGRALEEVTAAWSERMARLAEPALALETSAGAEGRVELHIRTRRGRRVPHRRMGALVRMALGPEREELAEMWLLEPADAPVGALRLRGADWAECFAAIGQSDARQVRLWSPLICPAGIRGGLARRGREHGLELREADCWAVLAVPRRKPEPPFPAPWRGNYGW
ncbi:MAG: hypothetical protein EYC70_14785 [Planctomycetota bacterium]|nr:MAG: hypothetical protein EYC70_14785 [Planctomycetota bacterium]